MENFIEDIIIEFLFLLNLLKNITNVIIKILKNFHYTYKKKFLNIVKFSILKNRKSSIFIDYF